jgi:hypothetical protein
MTNDDAQLFVTLAEGLARDLVPMSKDDQSSMAWTVS